MENPKDEIVAVVKLITMAKTPEVQRAAIEKYFAPNSGFNHPLCQVNRTSNSRNRILGIYQWYRNMSPKIDLEVDDVAYNENSNKLYLNISQKFHMFVSPFSTATAKLLVQLTLTKDDPSGLYFIIQQDDYYQFEEIANLVVPPLAGVILAAKHLGGYLSNVNTFVFQLFGFWRPIPSNHDTRAKSDKK